MSPAILLVYKISAFKEYYRKTENFPRHLRSQRQHVERFARTHQQHYQALEKIEGMLKAAGLRYHKRRRGRITDFSGYDVIITVGGDGTVLHVAPRVTTQTMICVNSDPQWSVGQFCSFYIDNFSRAIEQLVAGRLKTRSIPRLRLTVPAQKVRIDVLNDVLVCHKNPAAMSHYILQLGEQHEEQRGSGVWVATGAGSSGGVLSAGGRKISPTSRQLQYVPRELYSAHGVRYRMTGGVFDHQKLIFTSLMKDGVIYADGPHVAFPFHFGEKIEIAPAGRSLIMAAP